MSGGSTGPGNRAAAPGGAGAGAGEPAAARLRGVAFRYRAEVPPAVRDVTLSFAPGRHHAVLGPNGAGKSTLLRLLLGLLEAERGDVELMGRPVGAWSRREIARRVGVVTQEARVGFPLRVREYVEMGRHPYLRPWGSLGSEDREAVARALGFVEAEHLAERRVTELSGGELQRVRLARALSQEPRLLLLDEPTAHLDLGHEMRIFRLVRRLVRDAGMTAISVTHNLQLASRFATRLVLLVDGRVVGEGPPRDVLEPEAVERAYGWPVRLEDLGDAGLVVVPLEDGP